MRPLGRKNGMFTMMIAQLNTLHDYGCLTDEEAQSIADILHTAKKRADDDFEEYLDLISRSKNKGMPDDGCVQMKCKFCGAIFDLKDISKPIDNSPFGFVWVRDNCPNCKRGMDDWYERVRV